MKIRWFILMLTYASVAYAQPGAGDPPAGGGGSVRLSNPLGVDNLQTVLERAVPLVIPLAASVVTIMVLYGAFLMLFSAGNEEKVSQGRKTILYAAIGFFVVLVASSIPALIRSIFQ